MCPPTSLLTASREVGEDIYCRVQLHKRGEVTLALHRIISNADISDMQLQETPIHQ